MSARSRFIPDARHSENKNHASFAFAPRERRLPFLSLKSFRRKRLILIILALSLLYLFFEYIPTDVPPTAERTDPRYGRLRPAGPGLPNDHIQDPGAKDQAGDYNGPIRFHELGKSLRLASQTPPDLEDVVFAVSRANTISRVLQVACSMSHYNRSIVHLAFMGREMPAWDAALALNGISENDCKMHLHDARPDWSAQSSTGRLATAARASLGHLHTALKLRSVLVCSAESEDGWLVGALKEKGESLGLSIVTLPSRGLTSISWLSSLDASSLAHFGDVQVDIVIQAQPGSATSMMRLLSSIRAADYSGWKKPRIVVDLPPHPDPFLLKFLSHFRWPSSEPGSGSNLVLRHRIEAKSVTPAQAALRTVESFYPADQDKSHVLILSPNVEVSAHYYHYVMYTLLEYRYAAQRSKLVDHMVGIALDLPAYAPDGKSAAPWVQSRVSDAMSLWQTANSNAALFFGEQWLELHDFLEKRLARDADLSKLVTERERMSQDYPAWLQPMCEMMKSRDYYMLYPTFLQKEGLSVVTIHGELQQSPEEYVASENGAGDTTKNSSGQEPVWAETLTADEEVQRLMQQERSVDSALLVTALLEAISTEQATVTSDRGPEFSLFSFWGERVHVAESQDKSLEFAEEFSTSIGGCTVFQRPKSGAATLNSLFCNSNG